MSGRHVSPIDIRTRVEAVSRAGYTGMGISHADLVSVREDIGLRTLADVLADHNIKTVQLEWITNWWATGEARMKSDVVRADLLNACSVLSVDHIKVGADDDGVPVSYDQLCEGFNELANEAAEAGVKIAFENTPFSHHVKTTEQAARFITDVANPNGGLMLDIWHAFRGGTDYGTIPDLLPSEYIFGIELDDGLRSVTGTDLEDTFDNRLLCGSGEFDAVAFIVAASRFEFAGPWGVEHMSTTFRQLPIDVSLIRARDAVLDCFADAGFTAQPAQSYG